MSRKQPPAAPSGALVPVAPLEARPQAQGDPAFAAQMLGAKGVHRGLKGGAETLEAAKSTYLETEWSGDANRRAPLGGKASKAV